MQFDDARIQGANFAGADGLGYLGSFIASTASYKSHDLRGLGLSGQDLRGWILTGQDLTAADLSGARLERTQLRDAIIRDANLANTTSRGLKSPQLYETASYRALDLAGVNLGQNDLSGWNLANQSLVNATLGGAMLPGADLRGADLRGATGVDLTGAMSDHVIHPDGVIQGLRLGGGERFFVRDYDGGPHGELPPQAVVREELAMDAAASLSILLDSDPWDSTIAFEPDIPITFGGALRLAFSPEVDVSSQIGRSFTLFDFAGVAPQGIFQVSSAFAWDLRHLYSDGKVMLLASVALPGDTNADGRVDIVDLNNVRNHFGATGAPGLAGDTAPFDGVVNVEDLNAVRNAFGATTAQAVPEPSSLLFAALGLMLLTPALRRTQRRRKRYVAADRHGQL